MTRTYTFTQIAGLNRALRALPKDASVELRDSSQVIADKVAAKAADRARLVGGVAVHVAPTIRSRRDRIPKVIMGGGSRLPSGGVVGDVIWGAEFGGGRRPSTRQFDPWRGSGQGAGYFLWPTVRAEHDAILDEYGDAVIRAIDRSAARNDG